MILNILYFLFSRSIVSMIYTDGGYEGLSVNDLAGILTLKSASRVRNHVLEEMNEVKINAPIIPVQIIVCLTEYPTMHFLVIPDSLSQL